MGQSDSLAVDDRFRCSVLFHSWKLGEEGSVRAFYTDILETGPIERRKLLTIKNRALRPLTGAFFGQEDTLFAQVSISEMRASIVETL